MNLTFVDNVLLERNRRQVTFDPQPHLGLISLAAIARDGGHAPRIFDPKRSLADGTVPLDGSMYERLAMQILSQRPDLVGFTSLGCSFLCAVKTAAVIKREQPSIPIVFGGPHATILHREILERFPQVDVVVRHEAELTLLPLLGALSHRNDCQSRLAEVQGISFRLPDSSICSTAAAPLIQDLDVLPFPEFEQYNLDTAVTTGMRVEAGRGCPFECTFCSTASFFGRKYRLKTPLRLCLELDHLHSTYGINHFSLTHDMFTVNRHKVLGFCQEVQQRGYTWSCSARMDCVDAELLEAMSAAGCTAIYFGVETGSKRMQRVTMKKQDLDMFMPTLDVVRRLGITPTVSFITGYPQEEHCDQVATLDLIGNTLRRRDEGISVQLHLLTPEPGTALMAQFGTQLKYDGYVTDFNFPALASDDDSIMAENPALFPNHHYFVSTVPREQHIFVTAALEHLLALGARAIAFLLEATEASLGALVMAMYGWQVGRGIATPFSNQLLLAYCRDVWGQCEPRTSLVRYMITVNSLSQQMAEGHLPAAMHFSESTRYVLPANVGVLRGLHDCGMLIDRASQSGADLTDSNSVSDWAVVVSRDREARNVVVTPECADLLEFCRIPRDTEELSRYAHERWACDGDILREACVNLCAAELLTAVGSDPTVTVLEC